MFKKTDAISKGWRPFLRPVLGPTQALHQQPAGVRAPVWSMPSGVHAASRDACALPARAVAWIV
jgi:hypothetical protein